MGVVSGKLQDAVARKHGKVKKLLARIADARRQAAYATWLKLLLPFFKEHGIRYWGESFRLDIDGGHVVFLRIYKLGSSAFELVAHRWMDTDDGKSRRDTKEDTDPTQYVPQPVVAGMLEIFEFLDTRIGGEDLPGNHLQNAVKDLRYDGVLKYPDE